MNVTWSMRPRLGQEEAPNEIAWQYALDIVLGHAYTHDVERLRCISRWRPIPGLMENPLEMSRTSPVHEDALALFGVGPQWPPQARTVYIFDTSQRASSVHPPGSWVLKDHYYLYTHRAKVFGVLMRIARWLSRPDIEDWAVFRVRRHFIAKSPTFASFRLAIWVRD